MGYLQGLVTTGPLGDALNLSNATKFPWNRLTHVMDSFGVPVSGGGLDMSGARGSTLVLNAHANSTRAILSLGGANGSNQDYRAAWKSATNATNLAAFVTAITSQVDTLGYDGVDVDWEFPNEYAGESIETTQFTNLMSALYTAMQARTSVCGGCVFEGQKKQLTFFLSTGSNICGINWATIASNVDYAMYGGYDMNVAPGWNAPMSASGLFTDCEGHAYPLCLTSTVNHFTAGSYAGHTFPINKLILGMPLYDKQGGDTPVLNVLNSGTFIDFNYQTDEARYTYAATTHYVNNKEAFCRKMSWALSQKGMPGIGLWEVAHAYPQDNALAAPIWNVIEGVDVCVNISTPTPGPTPVPIPSGVIEIGTPPTGSLLAYYNLWGGQWATSADTTNGSSVAVTTTGSLNGASFYNIPGPYSIKVTGNKAATGWGYSATMYFKTPSTTQVNLDATPYNQLSFWFKSSVAGTFRVGVVRQTTITSNYNHFETTFVAPDSGWNYITVNLYDMVQTYGPYTTKQFNDSLGFFWGSNTITGPVVWEIDDVEVRYMPPTPTPTRTFTNTVTATRTVTTTITPTPSRTATPSLSPSFSPSPISSPTASPSASGTRSPTLSVTTSRTPTPSFSPSPTRSVSPTLTHTVPAGSTATATPSATPSFSVTRSSTTTGTPSVTRTSTSVFTKTVTPSYTASVSRSTTPSITVTLTASPSLTSAPPGSTLTSTPTSTLTWTATAIPVFSASPSPGGTLLGGNGELKVEMAFAAPNPVDLSGGLPLQFAVLLGGTADSVDISLYTVSMIKIKTMPLTAAGAGWTTGWRSGFVSASNFSDLGSGTYYYTVCAKRAGGDVSKPARGRLVLLR